MPIGPPHTAWRRIAFLVLVASWSSAGCGILSRRPSPATRPTATAPATRQATATRPAGPPPAPAAATRPATSQPHAATTRPKAAPPTVATPTVPGSPPLPEHAAWVNDEPITYRELADRLMETYGEPILTIMITRTLIERECRRLKVKVTRGEVDAEIVRDIKRIGAGTLERFVRVLQEKGGTLAQYADLVRFRLLRERLAERTAKVTDEDIRVEFEQLYGERLQLRWIRVATLARCQRAWEEIRSGKISFEQAALKYSEDKDTRSVGGTLRTPVGKGIFPAPVDKVLFALKPKETSRIFELRIGYTFFQLIERIEPQDMRLEDVREELRQRLHKSKVRETAGQLSRDLRRKAAIRRFAPATRPAEGDPHRALAEVNGHRISWAMVAESVVRQAGRGKLDGLIDLALLRQKCREAGVVVTNEEVNDRIDRSLRQRKLTREQMQAVERRQGRTWRDFTDEAWSYLALRRLFEEQIKVTGEEIEAAFRFQTGPRLKLRWMLVEEPRVAQQIQAKLAGDPSAFPNLAREYSVDPNSASKGGEIPELVGRGAFDKKVEDLLFKMKEGEISPVVQFGSRWAVFQCLKRVPPEPNAKLDDRRRQQVRTDLRKQKMKVQTEAAKAIWRKNAKIRILLTVEPPYKLKLRRATAN